VLIPVTSSGNRTRDPPACGAVPQSTEPLRAYTDNIKYIK